MTTSVGVDTTTRLVLIGPMPPPMNGQSEVMRRIVADLGQHFTRLRVADIGERQPDRRLGVLVRVGRSVAAWRTIPGSDAVYIAVKADHGMWLTTATAGLARLAGARVFLHHHSYCYVRERTPRMVALAHVAGVDAHHIVLSRSMARDLRTVMPEVRRTPVVGNAALVDTTLLDLPLRSDGGELVLGHLSNLCPEKGIAEVVDLACALLRTGTPARLIVGGPLADGSSRAHLDRAAEELGDRFDYRGPLAGQSKRAFFSDISHFVFPSRYVHESVPLVLYEAMAAGAICVATRQGSIPEQLAGGPAILASDSASFVAEVLPVLAGATASTADSRDAKSAYVRALGKSTGQLADLVELLSEPG